MSNAFLFLVCLLFLLDVFLDSRFLPLKFVEILEYLEKFLSINMNIPLVINFGISIGAYIMAKQLIPGLSNMFINANLFGNDLNKKTRPKM